MEVVPVGITGTRLLLENKLTGKDDKLILKLGRPIKTSSLNYEDRNIFAEDVRNEVVKLVKD